MTRSLLMMALQNDYDLFAFDLDLTLVELPGHSWTVFHDAFGVPESTRRQRLEMFKDNRLSYECWVNVDIGDWAAQGKGKADLTGVLQQTARPVKGAVDFLTHLSAAGKKLVLISGSIDLVRETLLPTIAFDRIFINHMSFDEEGKIRACTATNFDFEGKACALEQAADEFGIPLPRTVFVGDGENDCAALSAAGLGIAFAAPSLQTQQAADLCVPERDMTKLDALFFGARPAPVTAATL